MKKVLPLFMFVFMMSLANAQTLSRTEVGLDEFFLNTGKESWSLNIFEDVVQKVFEKSNSIYQFDLVYNGNVIYRGVLDKPIPVSPSADMMKSIVGFKKEIVFDDKLLSEEDRKKLLESHSGIKLIQKDSKGKHSSFVKAGGGVYGGEYKLLKDDSNSKYGYSLNHPLDNLLIKLYRIDF